MRYDIVGCSKEAPIRRGTSTGSVRSKTRSRCCSVHARAFSVSKPQAMRGGFSTTGGRGRGSTEEGRAICTKREGEASRPRLRGKQ